MPIHSIGGFLMVVGSILFALLFVGLIPKTFIGTKGLI
jgi:hypothetical protein